MKILLTAKEYTELQKTMVAYAADTQFEKGLATLADMDLVIVGDTLEVEVPEEMIHSLINLGRQMAPEVIQTISTLNASYTLFKGIFDSMFKKFKKFEDQAKKFDIGYRRTHFDNNDNKTWEITTAGNLIISEGYELKDSDYWHISKATAPTNVPVYLQGTKVAKRIDELRRANFLEIKNREFIFDEKEDGSVDIFKAGILVCTISAPRDLK